METKTSNRTYILYGVGTLGLIGLTYLGVVLLKKNKDEKNVETKGKETHGATFQSDDFTKQVDASPVTTHQSNTALPNLHTGLTFPLKQGDKGNAVSELQRSLIQSYGQAILGKYGADGYFGKELTRALQSKGYKVPLSKANYQTIIGKNNPLEKTLLPHFNQSIMPFLPIMPLTLMPPVTQNMEQLNPALNVKALANAFYVTISNKDMLGSFTLLSALKTPSDYKSISNEFRTYRIKSVRQTLVNALFSIVGSLQHRETLTAHLVRIGLKTDGTNWWT
jgi:hypothetical protein